MPVDKDHWYDGWFYDKLIAPNQDHLFSQIKKLIRPGSSVLDVGCGTGRLSFALADECRSIVGIDLSARNIKRARLTLSRNPDSKIVFKHANVTELFASSQEHFDYAVITYVIHEVDDPERVPLLKVIAEIADAIIVGEYLVPAPPGWRSALNELVEYAAGPSHYANFKSFQRKGGIRGLVETMPFSILQEIKNLPQTSHIVMLQTKGTAKSSSGKDGA
jgi:SAM-dependent methyltransferase